MNWRLLRALNAGARVCDPQQRGESMRRGVMENYFYFQVAAGRRPALRRIANSFAILLLAAATIDSAQAVETNSLSPSDFKSFKIISERNIFNPTRSKYVPSAPKPKPVRIEAFTLVGALGAESGRMAFFDSSRSEFRKALKAGDSIGGLKILQIDFHGVRLFSPSGKEITLSIGGQMKRQDEGEWVLATGESVKSSPEEKSEKPSSSGKAEKKEAPSAGGSEDDILKKLMQQREQELNK